MAFLRKATAAPDKGNQTADIWEEALNAIPEPVSIHDQDFHIVKANKAFLDMIGLPAGQIIGGKCFEVVHGRPEPWPGCPHQRSLQNGKSEVEEFLEPRFGMYMKVSCSPIVSEQNGVIGSVHIVRNISEQKKVEFALREKEEALIQAEQERSFELAKTNEQLLAKIEENKRVVEALRESETKYRVLFERSNDAIFLVDISTGRYMDANCAAEKLTGYSVAELKNLTTRDVCPKGAIDRLSKVKNSKGTIALDEVEYVRKDGTIRTALLAAVPLARNIFYGIAHDVTEHKHAETERIESMERYKAVVEAFDGFIYICSPDYRVEFMNQPMIERTGRNAVGDLCYKVLHDRDSICEWCVNARVFQGETVHWEVKSPKDNRWYFVVNTPIRHTDGSISKQAMIMDITERKEAEDALNETSAAFRNSQKDLKMLAGRLISAQEEELRRLSRELHDDLTQRLAVLAIEAGKLELDLGKIPAPCRETVQTISQIKDELIKVSEDVHNISRQLHPTILDDLGLVRAIESECAALTRRESIEIIFRKEDVPAAIGNDIALCLYRVLQEGLKNVIKHSGSKSCEIFLRGVNNTLCLTVSDNGVGFDPAEVRHKPGLGLSSMRERTRLVRGDFSIKSRPGQGTVIRIGVPLEAGGA